MLCRLSLLLALIFAVVARSAPTPLPVEAFIAAAQECHLFLIHHFCQRVDVAFN